MKLEIHFGKTPPSPTLVKRLRDAGAVINGAICYAEGPTADMLHIILLADAEPHQSIELGGNDVDSGTGSSCTA